MGVLQYGSRKLNGENNWKVYSPEGIHMFTTDRGRVNSYLKKNLAIISGENSIQLTFKPAGLGFAGDELFGLAPRINRCVVCAAIDELQRHHVVPYHYRKFMPLDYKSRTHHDIVLICRTHHEEYEELAKPYKTWIARHYGVGTIEELNNAYIENVVERLKRKFKIHKLLRTILDNFNDIPINKIEAIAQELSTMLRFNVLKLTLPELEKIMNKLAKNIAKEKSVVIHADEFYHGKAVISKFASHADFEVFIRGWRTHFVETMKPEFMPEGWSINFRVKK